MCKWHRFSFARLRREVVAAHVVAKLNVDRLGAISICRVDHLKKNRRVESTTLLQLNKQCKQYPKSSVEKGREAEMRNAMRFAREAWASRSSSGIFSERVFVRFWV